MRTERKNKYLLPTIAVGLIIIIGSVYYFNSFKTKEETTTIKVGYLPIYVDLPLFVAQEKGFFKKNGVLVELQRFETSPDMGTAIVNRNIDAAASIATSVALTTESRDPGKFKVFIVDAATKENYLSSFVALKSSGITKIEMLKGKKIGSFPGPTAVKFGKMVLEKFGIDPSKDVEWVELPANTHIQALGEKTVDALFTYEPIATQAVLEKDALKISQGAVETYIINPWQAGSWVINSSFLKSNPDLSKKFILSIYEALDYMRNNPNEYKDALLPYTKVKLNVANQTPDIPFTKISEVDIQTYQKYADLHTEKGLISKRIDVKTILLPSTFLENK